MIRILHSVSNMDRAGIETMLMNFYSWLKNTIENVIMQKEVCGL